MFNNRKEASYILHCVINWALCICAREMQLSWDLVSFVVSYFQPLPNLSHFLPAQCLLSPQQVPSFPRFCSSHSPPFFSPGGPVYSIKQVSALWHHCLLFFSIFCPLQWVIELFTNHFTNLLLFHIPTILPSQVYRYTVLACFLYMPWPVPSTTPLAPTAVPCHLPNIILLPATNCPLQQVSSSYLLTCSLFCL